MHMSHKKKASTAFKSIGAAGLAAATIVTGLSFGPLTAVASPSDAASITAADGAFIQRTATGWVAYDGTTATTTPPSSNGKRAILSGHAYSSLEDAIAAAKANDWDKWTFPAIGSTGYIKFGDQCAALMTPHFIGWGTQGNFTWTQFGDFRFTPCVPSVRPGTDTAVLTEWTMQADGSIKNRYESLLLGATGPDAPGRGIYLTPDANSDGWWSPGPGETVVPVDPGKHQLTATATFGATNAQKVTVSGDADANSTVVISDASGQIATATANADGKWSTTITAPARGGDRPITVTQDGSDYTPINLTVQYGAAVSITSPTTGESIPEGDVRVTIATQPGAELTVNAGGTPITRTATTSSETITVPGLTAGTRTIQVSQHSKGDLTTTDSVSVTVASSVAAPTGTVTFSDDITQNATVSGTGANGATITLYAGDSTTVIGTAVVRNGTWSTTIDPIGAGDQKIRIEQSGIDGTQTAETTAKYGAAVTLDRPASSTVTPGAVTVTGTGQAGTTVTINGAAKPVTTTVKADGTFTAEVELAPSNTAKPLTAQQHSKGNLTTSDTITLTPNGAQSARAVVITGPSSHTYKPNRETTISGTATPYAKVELRFQWSNTVYGTATADINGNWSITRGFGPAAKYELTATQTRFDTTTSTSTMFTLNPEGITNQEIVITGPADHSYKSGEATRITGTATPYAKIQLRFQWNDTVYGTATADAEGNWNILRSYGPSATYELTATQLRADGTTSLSNTFTLAPTGIDRPFTLTTPTKTSTFTPGVPVSFTGTGTRGATITAIAPAWNNNEIFTTTVDDNGKWELRRAFSPGITYDLTLVQTPLTGAPTTITGLHLTPTN